MRWNGRAGRKCPEGRSGGGVAEMSACHGQGERIGVINFDPILTAAVIIGEAAGVIGEDFVEAWRRLGGVHGDEQRGAHGARGISGAEGVGRGI